MRVYVDCDGVLADFDGAAFKLFGEDGHAFEDRYGSDVFWGAIAAQDRFFYRLKPLAQGLELINSLKLGGFKPIVLTGSPATVPVGHFDKQQWSKKVLGEKQPIITCQSKDKCNFCEPGDVIFDDFEKHKEKWESVGGKWITYRGNASAALEEFYQYIKETQQ